MAEVHDPKYMTHTLASWGVLDGVHGGFQQRVDRRFGDLAGCRRAVNLDRVRLTWAEDRATRGRDPSAGPGAKTGGGAGCPPP